MEAEKDVGKVWVDEVEKGGTVSAMESHLRLPHRDDIRYLYKKRFQLLETPKGTGALRGHLRLNFAMLWL